MGVLIQYCMASSMGCLMYRYPASAGIDANRAVGNELLLIAGKDSVSPCVKTQSGQVDAKFYNI
jgi:hypothetical protein